MTALLDAFWFFLPAGVANMTPVLANKVPLLNRWQAPLDAGQSWRGKRLLGANKTWRGLLLGTFMGGLTGWVIYGLVFDSGHPLSAFSVGLILGLGALVGDAAGSFVKRRFNIAPGRSWFPFDQLDYIVGGLLFIYPFTRLPMATILTVVALYFGLHLIVTYLGFVVGLRTKPI